MHSLNLFIARILIALIFIMSGINKILNYSGVTQKMSEEGVPMPGFTLAGGIIFLLIGAASLISGYKIKLGVALLSFFVISATYFFHDFWTFEGDARKMQTIQFSKNLALLGGLLALGSAGAGRWSLKHLKKSKTPKEL